MESDFCLDNYFSLINASKHKDIHLSTLNQFNPKSTMCFRENNEDGNTKAHKIYQLAVMHNERSLVSDDSQNAGLFLLHSCHRTETSTGGGEKKS